jgi:pantoate--beta-alanine ligase
MVIFKKVTDIQDYLYQKKISGKKIGFIPTMGALHAGHISLVQKAIEDNTFSVCSIFLNPTQFNDKNDLIKYPVSTENDIELLIKAGCNVLFLPDVEEVYPGGSDDTKTYDFGYLDTILEGAKRPGHFKGVGQVVGRLLEIVKPDTLYLGQKDYQQCLVIRKLTGMMGIKGLDVVICPTTREQDGLAMSSRNRRLTDPQRIVASTIYQCLVSIDAKQANSSFDIVKKECEELLAAKGIAPEYVELADARDLTPLRNYQPGTPMIALIAARIGDIRLIDNRVLNSSN